jgi:RNA polymerase sigma-70 factor (ECF subfamily)
MTDPPHPCGGLQIFLETFCLLKRLSLYRGIHPFACKQPGQKKEQRNMFGVEKLKKAQEGDLESIEEICASTWESVYRFIYYKVQNREEAEDITQEAYVKALSHFKKKSANIDRHISFLKTVSLNILRDKWRKNKRWGTKANFEKINPAETAIEDPTEAIAQRMSIQNALNSLNEEQRTVIELRILKGYSVAETSRAMNKKESTVRVLQYRALQALSVILGHND